MTRERAIWWIANKKHISDILSEAEYIPDHKCASWRKQIEAEIQRAFQFWLATHDRDGKASECE